MKRRRIFFLLSLQQSYYCNVAVWTALNKRLAQLSTLNNRNSPLLSLQKQPMTKSETAFWEDWITLTHNGIRLRAYIQILDATWKVLFLIRGCVKFITMMVDEVYENNVNISPYLIIYIYIYNDILMKTDINLPHLVLQTKNISPADLYNIYH